MTTTLTEALDAMVKERDEAQVTIDKYKLEGNSVQVVVRRDAFRFCITKLCEGVRGERDRLTTSMGMGGYDESVGGRKKLPRWREEYRKGKKEEQQESLDILPTEEVMRQALETKEGE